MVSLCRKKVRCMSGLIITMMLVCFGLLKAQQVYPVWVTPMPAMFSSATVYLGDFAHTEATAGRINFMLELRDPVELSRQVHFRLHVERNGTTVMMTDPGFMPPVITLQKNVPVTINGTDLAFYFDLNHLVGVSGFELNNVLTEDFYSICIEVIDLLRQEPISDKVCVSGFLNQLSPPILYMPQSDAMLSYGQYNNMMFHWQLTGISLLFQSNIRYDLQVRELTEGIDNYQDAFESHNLIFDQTDLYNFSLVYDAGMPPLVRGKKYVWRVRAFARDFSGMEIPGYFHNNGYSEIWQFELPEDNTSSGEFCNPREPKPVQNRVPLRELSVNDVVHVGHFDMTITSVDNSTGESSSGIGKVEIPFLDMEVEARFDNLAINEKKDAFAGQGNVVQTIDLLSKLKANNDGTIDFTEAGAFTNVDVENIIAASTNNSNALTTRLPFSLKKKLKDLFDVEMPYDLIVTDMWFTSLGAKFNAMMLVPDGHGGYARFGASNVDVDNAGLALKELFLFLSENTSMPGFDKQPVIVMAKGGDITPEQGSYLTFDCNGFKEFNLQGRYEFDKERAVRASNTSLAASASFTIKTTKWGEFVSAATMPDFALQGMEDWRFHVTNAVADFSPDDKNGHKELLGDIDSLDTKWKGFYIKELTVKLPQDLRFENETALVMATRNLLIDSSGANGALSGQNLLALGTGDAGGWGLSFEEMNLHIVQDSFADAEIKGKIIVAPVGDTVIYNGKIFTDRVTGLYALDLIPQGTMDLPYLKGGFTFKPGSVVSIRKEMPECVTAWKPYADLNVDLNMKMQEGDFTKLGGSGMSDKMAQVKTGLGTTQEFTFDVSGLSIDGFKINHPDLPQGRQFGYDDTSISNGEISLAGVNMNLGGFDLLEEAFEMDGSKKGLGMGFHTSLGAYGIISKFWALDNGMEASLPFSLALIEIDFPKVPKQLFNCECKSPEAGSGVQDYCKPPVAPEEITSLAVGSTIKVGHFEMEVITLSGNNGKGKIPIPFLGSEMEVDFKDLLIDDHGMMTQGTVRSAIDPMFADITEDALQKESGLLHMEKIKDTGAFMNKINTHMEAMGDEMKCPISVNGIVQKLMHEGPAGQFDFLLMGIHFGPDSATLNSLAIFKTPEGKYLKFGLAGIGLRPDGFDLEERKFFLDEEVTVPAYQNQQMRLLASAKGDPGSGSFILYDCDGFKQFDLQAIIPFSNTLLVNTNNRGSAAEAMLHIQSPVWGNFTSKAVMTPFMLPQLDGWNFEPVESGADFSINQNLESFFFSGSYTATGFDWQGLYVKKLKVTLPDELRLYNNHKIEMEAENLVIDHFGVTCSLVGNDLLPMHHPSKRAFNFSLVELQLDIRKNQFEQAYIKGDARIAPLSNSIAYEGIIYKEPISSTAPNGYYAIDIVPVENYISEFLKINFAVGKGSYITYRKRTGHYIRYAGINAHIVADIPDDRMHQMMTGMGYGYVAGCLNLLGIQHIGYHSEVGIKNMRILHPSLPPGKQIGVQGYRRTQRFFTSQSGNL